MKISRFNFLLFISLLATFFYMSSCNLILFLPAPKEVNEKDYIVHQGTKPSDLISKFIDTTVFNKHHNYIIVTFDPGCGATYSQIKFTNKLYDETRQNYEWLAVTNEDLLLENKVRKFYKYPDDFRYSYTTYYSIHGLKPSLRNLYHNNNIPDSDLTPMTFIITSDTIRRITRGAINNEERYLEHKNFLDSLSQIQQ